MMWQGKGGRVTNGRWVTPTRLEALKILERVEGIEPSSEAWEATVLPLNYTRFGVTQCVLKAVPSKNPRYQLGKLE
jgi:hypothetical protein